MASKRKVLIVGGGIAGITSAVELAEAGTEVLLVEKEPYLGGRVSQMNQYFPKMCPPACGMEINFRNLRNNPRIRCFTHAKVRVKGEQGNFRVQIRQSGNWVGEECTLCGDCLPVCPEERVDSFNFGLGTTRAIHFPFAGAYPARYTIDETVCLQPECSECASACPCNAIRLDGEEKLTEDTVNSVIVATGWNPFDGAQLENLGFGRFENVVTNVQMERLASPTGPTQGKIPAAREQGLPARVCFVQCAGSRDENHLRHCSGVCCLASLKQVRYVREQFPEAEISLFYIDLRTPGRFEDFLSLSKEDPLLELIKGKVAKVERRSPDQTLTVVAEDVLSGKRIMREAELVVLATGLVPQIPRINGPLVGDEHGFLVLKGQVEGIVPAGCVRRPADVAETVRDATAAAMRALSGL